MSQLETGILWGVTAFNVLLTFWIQQRSAIWRTRYESERRFRLHYELWMEKYRRELHRLVGLTDLDDAPDIANENRRGRLPS